MTTSRTLLVASIAGLAFAGTAYAQEEPVAPEATVAEEAPAAEEDSAVAGWFRLDTDSLGTQFWLGATHSIGGIDLASDIYVVGSFAEFDIGPAFAFGNLALTPMVGIGFDFSTTDVTTLIAPQLFTIWQNDSLYFESWIQGFINSIFAEGTQDLAYTRNYLLYKLNGTAAIGPQVEVTYLMNDFEGDMAAGIDPFEAGVVSLPVGGHVDLAYGKNNTLGLFVGYETKATDGVDAIAGRFTFIRTW